MDGPCVIGSMLVSDNPKSCAFCQKTASELTAPLKRCGRCNVAMYCSKECQQSSWPSHKPLCLSRSERPELDNSLGDESYGYTSGMSPTSAALVWSKIHAVAIRAMINALVAIDGGVDLILETQRSVVFCLEPRENVPDDNPAKAFKISHLETALRSEHYFLKDSWDQLQAARQAMNAVHLAENSPGRPEFRGAINVAFVVVGTGAFVHRQYGLWKSQYLDDTALNDAHRDILREFISLCITSLAFGYCYYTPDPPTVEPAVGTFVRSKKTWKRRPVDVSETYWDGMATFMRNNPDIFKSGSSPRMLWAACRML